MDIGKLKVDHSIHRYLGTIITIEVPIECTDLVTKEDGVVTVAADVPSITLRLTPRTALDLAEYLEVLVFEARQEPICGAI